MFSIKVHCQARTEHSLQDQLRPVSQQGLYCSTEVIYSGSDEDSACRQGQERQHEEMEQEGGGHGFILTKTESMFVGTVERHLKMVSLTLFFLLLSSFIKYV